MSGDKENLTVLVLGASGMLGNAILRFFSQCHGYEVFGSVRSQDALELIPKNLQRNIFSGINVENSNKLASLFCTVRPGIVINCIGLIKQLAEVNDPLSAISLNALFPHRLAHLCSVAGARLIHFSTDCVFSGVRGMYIESDVADANDLYGRSKYLGEVNYPNAITLRTSIIGHELGTGRSLLEWFLAQEGTVKGFRRAIFSGLPTLEIAKVIRNYVLPNPNLQGLYHLSAEPISKFELLMLIAKIYGKTTKIISDENLIIDRSLDSSKFKVATGYKSPQWPEMIKSINLDSKIWNIHV
jgi:dTDP-4-dehydrorhamnose reductase